MLPILIYEPAESERERILSYLRDYGEAKSSRFSILTSTGSMDEADFCLRSEGGILLVIIGVADPAAAALEQKASERNRDSYVMYWLHDTADLPELAARCLHPAGFILPPPDRARFETVLDRICEDYAALTDSSDAGTFLTLQSGGAVYRIAVSDIDYIEALDKKLNIWTKRQCLTVYEKLSRAEELLGDRFFRCHRSYLVNYARIESVDLAGMELTLAGGARLPLARSAKDKLKTRMAEESLARSPGGKSS